MSQSHILREGIEEEAETAPDHGFFLACYVPCGTDAGSKVRLVGVIKLVQPWLADLRKGKGIVSRVQIGDGAQQVVLLADHAIVIPAQTVVNGKTRGNAETVLSVESEVVFEGVAYGVTGILESTVYGAREEIGEIVECQLASEVLAEVLLNGCAVEIDTDFDVMLVQLPREVVENLNVAVDAVARGAGAGPKLGKGATVDGYDRQSAIGESGAGIETDRAR